jgi:hypothetical protein
MGRTSGTERGEFEMKFKKTILRALTLLLAAFILIQAFGCGTLIYPERRGQTSGHIDPGVAILDGAGLLLFVSPGLVAFGVDFSTGAIYMPGRKDKAELGPTGPPVVVRVNPDDLSLSTIENVLEQCSGKPIKLDPKKLEVRHPDRTISLEEQLSRLLG